MADYKEVWMFSGHNSAWTEVLHSQAGTLADAANFKGVGFDARLAMLNKSCTLKKIRISEVGNPRVSTLVNVNKSGLATGVPLEDGVSAVLTLSSSVVPSTRKLWMRGLTQGDTTRDVTTFEDSISPAFRDKIKDYIDYLASAATKYEVLPLAKPGTNSVVLFRVTSVNGTAGTGKSILTSDVAHNLAVGKTVILSQFNQKILPGLKGKFTVEAVDGLTFTIAYKTPNNATVTPITGKGKLQFYVTGAFINKANSGWSYTNTRSTKSFATGSRGAARANRIRLV